MTQDACEKLLLDFKGVMTASRALGSSAAAGRGSESRRGGGRLRAMHSPKSQEHNPAISEIQLGQEEERASKL